MLDFSFFYAHFYDIPYKRYDFYLTDSKLTLL